MTNSEKIKEFANKYAYYAIIAGGFVYLLDMSWCRWGETIIDTFRDQIVADRLAHGKILYKDAYYLFGILPPHLLALLNKVFGTTIYCSVWLGIFLTALCCVFIYRITRLYLDRLPSSLATLTFLFVCAFNYAGQYGGSNYILPYSLATVITITLILASLYNFLKYITASRPVYFYAWIFSQYLIFLSRIDITIPVFLLFVFFGSVHFFREKKTVMSVFLIIPVFLAVGTYALYFAVYHNYSYFAGSVLRMIFLEGKGSDPFALYTIGYYNYVHVANTTVLQNGFIENISKMWWSFAGQFVIIVFFIFLNTVMERIEKAYLAGLARKIITWIILISVSALLMYFAATRLIDLQYRSLPLFMILSLIICLFKIRSDFAKYFSLLALVSVSLAMLLRIFFNVSILRTPYGVFFLIPGLIAYFIAVAELVPSLIKPYFLPAQSQKYFIALLSIFIVALSLSYVNKSRGFYLEKNYLIGAPGNDRGAFYHFKYSGTICYNETIKYLNENTPAGATVVVFPEGCGINYFSGRESPMRYEAYIPIILNTIGEEKMLQELRSAKIDYVVMTYRPCFEHGFTYFGADFGVNIYKWILDNYEIEKQFGDNTLRSNGALIFKKKLLQ